jgi:hypothetical protein
LTAFSTVWLENEPAPPTVETITSSSAISALKRSTARCCQRESGCGSDKFNIHKEFLCWMLPYERDQRPSFQKCFQNEVRGAKTTKLSQIKSAQAQPLLTPAVPSFQAKAIFANSCSTALRSRASLSPAAFCCRSCL